MPTATPPAELAHRFRRFAADQGGRAPFTARLSATIADAPGVVAILAEAPHEQQLPVLLLAAIHDQVLADPTCALGAWFPTVVAEPRSDDVAGALLAHCHERADDLRSVVATRSVQTNEVGRCGLLLPAFGIIADELGPLAWIDVGTSGGLTLLLDRFEFAYRAGDRLDRVGGPSAVRVDVGTRGAVPVPERLPEIAVRIGLDREPFDLADPARARWLRACVWPDQTDRFRRLDAAIAIARTDPVEIRRGDAVDDLATAVDDVSASVEALGRGGHVVVTNTWVLSYLPSARRLAYVAELDRVGRQRDLSWIFAESPDQAPGLPFDPSVEGRSITALVLVRWRRGERRVDHLGTAHPHGTWLHWRDA